MSGAAVWWLRSPYANGDSYVWYVYAGGSNYYLWYNGSYGVRPALMEPCDE